MQDYQPLNNMSENRTGPDTPGIEPFVDGTQLHELHSLGAGKSLQVTGGGSADESNLQSLNKDDPDVSSRLTTTKFFSILALAANYVGTFPISVVGLTLQC